jgi:hypothetical protein
MVGATDGAVSFLASARDGKTRFIRVVMEEVLSGDLEVGISIPDANESLLELERMGRTLLLQLGAAEPGIFVGELLDLLAFSLVGVTWGFTIGWFRGVLS